MLDTAAPGPFVDARKKSRPDEDPAVAAPADRLARALASLRAHASLADGMRLVGTLLLVAGLSSFLLAGVDVRNDLQRFGLLIAQTATFTAVAFALARWLDDARGARVLFGVAALSVPAAFTVLGAMLYSVVAWDAPPDPAGSFWNQSATGAREMPAFARWHLASARDLTIAGLIAAVTLVPVTFFALAVLGRRSATRLGIATLLASAFLLMPVRDPAWAGLLVLGSTLVALLAQRGLSGRDIGLQTPGGRFARALPFVPAIVIGARALLVDDPGPAFLTLGALAILIASRAALRATARTSGLHLVLLPLGVLCAVTAGVQALWLLPAGLRDAAALLPFVPVAVVLIDFGRCSAALRTRRLLENLWGTGLLLCAASWSTFGYSAHPPWTLIVPALAVMALATWRGRVWLGVLGSATLLWGVSWLGVAAVEWLSAHAWVGLAGFGLAAVVGASVVQRHGPVIAARARVLRRRGAAPSPDLRAEELESGRGDPVRGSAVP